MFDEQDNLAIVKTELDDVFFQYLAYDGTNPSIATANTGALFNQQTIDRQAYIYEINKDVGLFDIIGETAQVPLDVPAVRNKVTATMKDFAKAIELSKDLYDDVMHGVWAQDVKKFAMKARLTQDAYAFGKYNGAFSTTLTADGSAAIGSHTLIGGGTYNNQILAADVGAATTALSNDSFNTAMVKMREMVDQSNVVIGDNIAYLLVPPKLFQQAIQVTESALVSGGAQNNINVWRSAYDVEVFSTPYLANITGIVSGSDTAWFGLSRNHSVTRIIRQGVQTFLRDWGYSNNRTYNYQANFREEVVIQDYAGLVGALGDAT